MISYGRVGLKRGVYLRSRPLSHEEAHQAIAINEQVFVLFVVIKKRHKHNR